MKRINTHKLKVKVTDEHIKRGGPDSCDKCAIALAVQNAINSDGAPWKCNVEFDSRITTARINLKTWSSRTWDDEVVKDCFVVGKDDKEKINQFVNEFDSNFIWDYNTEECSSYKPIVHCKPFDFELEVIT